MLLYTLTVFLSAFLLFEVQPVVAKMILPWFGGTSTVWSTCMLFFQVVLLMGYLYAHWLNGLRNERRQAAAHSILLAVSVGSLPILPNPAWRSVATAQPSLRILALLTVTVGLPYFLLSSTSPLLQAWYVRTHKSAMPYRLFALSNAASLLALLSYPFLIEPNLPAGVQAWSWSGAYVLFAIACGATAWRAARTPAEATRPAVEAAAGPAPSSLDRILWLGLAASASVLLLAVTTHITQDVAAIPFLWILPLTMYLLTFIVCFEAPWLYSRRIFLPLFAIALAFMAYRLWPYRESTDVPWLRFVTAMSTRATLAAFCGSLFVCCMVCHGELVRLKPDPRHLTLFYVMVSLGGAAGGLFVGLVAPNFFHAYYEFPLGLGFCAVVAGFVLARTLIRRTGPSRVWAVAAVSVLIGAYAWGLGIVMRDMVRNYRVVARNFYGQLRVFDDGDVSIDENANRKLVHGTINHGEQMLREAYRREPVTYFCPDSGIGRAMRSQEGRPRRIGILGLGCGTLAAYGRAGDIMRIYEINPLVLQIANTQFSYLRDTAARVEVIIGDGRLRLDAEPSQRFDLLVMDAFSGDSVPVHLITLEAFRTYFRHLKADGILAVNISNRYLNLQPVMERAASAIGKVAMVYEYRPPDEEFLCFSCTWTLVMSRDTLELHPELKSNARLLRPERPFRIWTDDYSNLFGILK